MRKVIFAVFVILLTFLTTTVFAAESKKLKDFAQQGVVVIGGSASFAYTRFSQIGNQPSYTRTNLSLQPNFDYYFIDSFYGGVGLSLSYANTDLGQRNYVFFVAPTLNLGYTATIVKGVFFNLEFSFGNSYYALISYGEPGLVDRIRFSVSPGLKWAMGQALISVGLPTTYTSGLQEYISTGLVTGFSVYF